jgi:hypothetical protein
MLRPGDRCLPKMQRGQQHLNKSIFFSHIRRNDNPEAGVLNRKSAT